MGNIFCISENKTDDMLKYKTVSILTLPVPILDEEKKLS